MSHVMGVGIFRIGLNRTDVGCWRLTLKLIVNPIQINFHGAIGETLKILEKFWMVLCLNFTRIF